MSARQIGAAMSLAVTAWLAGEAASAAEAHGRWQVDPLGAVGARAFFLFEEGYPESDAGQLLIDCARGWPQMVIITGLEIAEPVKVLVTVAGGPTLRVPAIRAETVLMIDPVGRTARTVAERARLGGVLTVAIEGTPHPPFVFQLRGFEAIHAAHGAPCGLCSAPGLCEVQR